MNCRRHFIHWALFLILAQSLTGIAAAGEDLTPLGEIDRSMLDQEIDVKGLILTHRMPWSERAPHILTLADDGGEAQVVFWADTYEAIPDKEKLKIEAEVRVHGKVQEFRGNLQINVDSPEGVKVVTPAPEVSPAEAMASVEATPLSALTTEMQDQKVRVGGKIVRIQPSADRRPWNVTLEQDGAQVPVVFWQNFYELLPEEQQPAEGKFYHVIGRVGVFREAPQILPYNPEWVIRTDEMVDWKAEAAKAKEEAAGKEAAPKESAPAEKPQASAPFVVEAWFLGQTPANQDSPFAQQQQSPFAQPAGQQSSPFSQAPAPAPGQPQPAAPAQSQNFGSPFAGSPPPPGGAVEVIVDNDDPGFTAIGNWAPSVNLGFWGDDSLYNTGDDARAVWTPNLPVPGRYEVAIWYLHSSNRSTDVTYEIVHAEGRDTVTVNQQVDGSTWKVLGTYPFKAGTDGYLAIANLGTGEYVSADAARFRQVTSGGTVPQAATTVSDTPRESTPFTGSLTSPATPAPQPMPQAGSPFAQQQAQQTSPSPFTQQPAPQQQAAAPQPATGPFVRVGAQTTTAPPASPFVTVQGQPVQPSAPPQQAGQPAPFVSAQQYTAPQQAAPAPFAPDAVKIADVDASLEGETIEVAGVVTGAYSSSHGMLLKIDDQTGKTDVFILRHVMDDLPGSTVVRLDVGNRVHLKGQVQVFKKKAEIRVANADGVIEIR